jgi:hypothetical protein
MDLITRCIAATNLPGRIGFILDGLIFPKVTEEPSINAQQIVSIVWIT